MGPTVSVRGLSMTFGRLRALVGVDLDLGAGVTGLLGRNGAGKTTLLRCLATTLAPDRGQIRAFDLDPADPGQRIELRRRIGYLPQAPGFYQHFTAFELVDYVAILKELTDRRQRHAQVRRVLEEVGLTDRATTKVRKLSGGMRQRLALAQALLGDPELLVLDEPSVGLDPEQRAQLRTLLSRLGRDRTVLLSTHQTEDVAALCGRVVVLLAGAVRFDGTPPELAEHARGKVWLTDQPPATPHSSTEDLSPESVWSSWRTADGRYRVLGERPAGAEPAEPSIEDGYLVLARAVDRAEEAALAGPDGVGAGGPS